VRTVAEWIVRRVWPFLPWLPPMLFVGIVVYVGTCNPSLPCQPLIINLHLPSEQAIPKDVPVDPAVTRTARWLFRYAPTGTEANAGVPYWIFRALPSMYPEEFPNTKPGHEWEAFGLFPDDDPQVYRPSGVPRGMVLADTTVQGPGIQIGVGLERVAFNCAACHQGEYLDDAGDRHLIDGMGNTVVDTQGYKNLIRHVIARDDFTPQNVIAAVDDQLARVGAPPLDRWEQEVYKIVVEKMHGSGSGPGGSWMDRRPLNGPGRIDAFSAVKYETLHAPDDGHIATVDLPAIWNEGADVRKWHHADGNTDNQRARNYGSVVGVGGSASSVRGQIVDAVGAWLDTQLGPPRFPFTRPGTTPERVARGKQIYMATCARCHGVYDPATRQVATAQAQEYMRRVDVKTDPWRLQAFDQATCDALNAWGFERGIWSKDAFRPATSGYLVRPLDGVWARAPYLHDGSVPTLRALVTEPKPGQPSPRPTTFYRGSRRYDPADMGWEWREPIERGTERPLFQFDTGLPGNGGAGHEFYVADDEVDALLDYLAGL
jgi:mono/diheme cytochrome c family protein